MVRIPWLITLISAMKRMTAKRISRTPAIIDRQSLQGEKGQDQRNAADDARDDDAGVGEFEVQPRQPHQQKDIGDIGIADRRSGCDSAHAHLLVIERDALWSRMIISPVEHVDLLAVHLGQELFQVRRDSSR